ncbi:unnamed protein product [Lota lota]
MEISHSNRSVKIYEIRRVVEEDEGDEQFLPTTGGSGVQVDMHHLSVSQQEALASLLRLLASHSWLTTT